ncbi:MAG: ArnT family glycosyltransferase [Candidatus Polarisedimenticolia bacterium]
MANPRTPGIDAAVIAPLPPDRVEERAGVWAACLLLVLAAQGILFIAESSQTSDEAAHLAAGYSYLTRGDFRLNPEHPPLLKQIAALPLLPLDLDFPGGALWDTAEEWNIGRIFVHENRVANDTLLFLGRLPILLLSLGLGAALFSWGRRLFGARGGLLGLALYVLDPNVVAHSCLVTTDLGVTLFMFLTVHALWRWSETPAPRTLLAAGLCLGGAFASKFTALWILPVLALLAAALWLLGEPLPERPWTARSAVIAGDDRGTGRARGLAGAFALMGAIAAAVLALSYFGVGLRSYVHGLIFGLSHSGAGHPAYLMGAYSETGWWYYFLFAWLVKTPPGIVLVVAASIAAFAAGRRLRLKDELFLWIPVGIFVAITCMWRVNIGLRHLLPIYPFLYLSAGRLLRSRTGAPPPAGKRRVRTGRFLLAAALAWTVWEAAAITPHQLAYFNVLAGGPANGHRYLLDSNLDWGQSAKALRRYLDAERVPIAWVAFAGNSDPWYCGVRYQYAPGSGNLDNAKLRPERMPDGAPRELLAIGATVLHSVHFSHHDLYDWLRERRPIATPGYSTLVFDLTGDYESQARLAVLYLNFRLRELAGYQARRTLRRDPGNVLAQAVLQQLSAAAPGEPGPRRP